jgi:hypothetical protein
MLGHFPFFYKTVFSIVLMFPDTYKQRTASFANVTSVTFARNAVDVACCELGITHWSGSHECVPKFVLGFENLPDIPIPILE